MVTFLHWREEAAGARFVPVEEEDSLQTVNPEKTWTNNLSWMQKSVRT